MKSADILIIGGDGRQSYCHTILKSHGHRVNQFLVPDCTPAATSPEILKKYLSTAKYILCPIPFSRDSLNITTSAEYSESRLSIELLFSMINPKQTIIGGAFSKAVTEALTKNDIPFYDLMEFKSLTYANAQLTAEGLLKDIIETVPFSIPCTKILILGYGCCGSAIARTLGLLGGSVTVYNRNKYYDCKARAVGFTTITTLPAGDYLSKFDIIINTIPNVIYTREHMACTSKSAYLFDIASAPGGFAVDFAKSMNIQYRNCPGIPGKTAPGTAARIICDVLNEEIM